MVLRPKLAKSNNKQICSWLFAMLDSTACEIIHTAKLVVFSKSRVFLSRTVTSTYTKALPCLSWPDIQASPQRISFKHAEVSTGVFLILHFSEIFRSSSALSTLWFLATRNRFKSWSRISKYFFSRFIAKVASSSLLALAISTSINSSTLIRSCFIHSACIIASSSSDNFSERALGKDGVDTPLTLAGVWVPADLLVSSSAGMSEISDFVSSMDLEGLEMPSLRNIFKELCWNLVGFGTIREIMIGEKGLMID
mmetsp:Transcript_18317/g.31731  ORF Transcript_18317/g.31731 Transcript_18317/m.31731 type:complete len:253 (-) Transcript_18317:58-816(-)